MAPWPTQPTTKAAHAAERSRSWQHGFRHGGMAGAVLALKFCLTETRNLPATTRFSTKSRTQLIRSLSPLRASALFANCSGSAPVRTARLSRAARPVSQLIGYLGLDSALPVAVAALPSDLFTGRGGGSGGGKTEAERLWWRRRWHWFG